VTAEQFLPDLAPDELDRVEELVRHLAAHDGRLPTDDMPLSWWLVGALDRPQGDPVRQVLAGIPLTPPGRALTPKKAHAWSVWLARRDLLAWSRAATLDEAVAKNKTLRDWVNDMLTRHRMGKLGLFETLTLQRTPLWDFDREPDTRGSRKVLAFKVGITAVQNFHREHGHTRIPEGYVAAGVDVKAWWTLTRAHYASGALKEDQRAQVDRLARTGVDLRTDKEIAKEEKRRAAEEARLRLTEEQREKRRQERAAQRGTEEAGPILDAIRAFAERHGHTGIPVGAVTQGGVEFGRFADRWRRVKPDRGLRQSLEAIPHWTWMRTPASPTVQRPAPVAIPDDTTRMNKAGLRQFLPTD